MPKIDTTGMTPEQRQELAEKTAMNYFRQGLNCTECVAQTFMDMHDTDLPEKVICLLTGFGGGMGATRNTCGAITGALSEMGGQVDCVDLSLRRSRINAYRHCYADNVRIHVGNFQVVEEELPADYDYIFLIGAFEYGGLYIGGENPYRDFLEILKKHLAPGGRIIIAIENKTGMKYWAGCREDHNGEFFSGLEDYPGGGPARTFTARELRQLARSAGFGEDKCEILYPYPDYKFMHTLFSDRRLPEVGECKTNLCNYDRDRWEIFDEKLVYDMVIRDGNFPFFSNSISNVGTKSK
jgi:hypothetical protein